MKNALKAFALLLAVLFGGLVAAAPAQAAMVAPRYGDHVTYYNCSGPYWQYNIGWYYWCYGDFDWYAEVFQDKDDMWLKVKAWYTA